MKIVGHVDSISDCRIRGWAASKSALGKYGKIKVCVVYEANIVSIVQADTFRSDLKAAGIADGCHGFSLELPDEFRSAIPREVMVQDFQSRKPLEGGKFYVSLGIVTASPELGAAYGSAVDQFNQARKKLSYLAFTVTLDDARKTLDEVGPDAAVSLIYAKLLGRMPEQEKIDFYKNNFSLGLFDLKSFAHEVFYSEEGRSRRSQ